MVLAAPELTKASVYHSAFALNKKDLFAVRCPHSEFFCCKMNNGWWTREKAHRDDKIQRQKLRMGWSVTEKQTSRSLRMKGK